MEKNDVIKEIYKSVKIRAYHYRQVYRYTKSPLRKKRPLLIYQMGKVGSSTIRRSLEALNLDIHVYHMHYLSGIGYMMKLCRAQSLPLQDHILTSIYCKKMLKRQRAHKTKLSVISMVREPISKNISQFFQNVHVSYPEFRYSEKLKTLSQENLIDEMEEFFIKNFMHDDPLVWFDVELKQFTNIDVYKESFPHEKGYRIYENEHFRILLIRLENLNSKISEAMNRFLGIKNFILINENISKEKEYSQIYEEVKRKIKVPENYIEKMYSSKMAQHFYTSSEIDNFKKKWQRTS